MTAAAAPARRFLLRTWAPALGACVDVVGVLAVAVDPHARPAHAVVWLPRVWDRATGWQTRLAGVDDVAAALVEWLHDGSGLQLTEIDPAPATVDLRTAAEFAVDDLLAVVVPVVDQGEE